MGGGVYMKIVDYKAYESVPNSLQILDEDGVIIFVNKMWLNELGYDREDVIEKKFEDFLSEKSKKIYYEKCSKSLKEKKLAKTTYEVKNSSGKILQLVYNSKANLDRDGNIKNICCTFIDLTDSIKEKQELEFKELYRKTIFNTEPDLLVTTFGDKIDDGNLAMLEFTDYSSVDAFKKEHDCICDLFEKENGYLYKEMDGINWLEYIYLNPTIYHKVSMQKNNKNYIFHVYAKKLYFDELNRSLIIFNDITDLTAYQEKLLDSERNLKRSHKLSKMGYWEFDIKNYRGRWSEMLFEIFELSPNKDMITPDTYFEYIFEEDMEKAKNVLNDTIKHNKVYKLDYRIKTKNNHVKYIYEEADLEFDKNGKPIKLFGYAMDITEKSLIQEQLVKNNEIMLMQSRQAAMGEMINLIAHQWRQPLTVISMDMNNIEVSIQLGEEISNQELEKYVHSVNDEVKHLTQTIDDFRDYFKPNKEKQKKEISYIIDGAKKIIASSLKNNNIEFIVQLENDYTLYTYPNEVLQVLLNIINNAKDVLKDKNISNAKITLSIFKEENNFIIKICDNGGGIPKDAIDKIGTQYFTTKGDKGTGLGLYMSKKVVEEHLNGSLSWKNISDGACFIITLFID